MVDPRHRNPIHRQFWSKYAWPFAESSIVAPMGGVVGKGRQEADPGPRGSGSWPRVAAWGVPCSGVGEESCSNRIAESAQVRCCEKMRKAWELADFTLNMGSDTNPEAPASPAVSVPASPGSVVHSSANLPLMLLKLEVWLNGTEGSVIIPN